MRFMHAHTHTLAHITLHVFEEQSAMCVPYALKVQKRRLAARISLNGLCLYLKLKISQFKPLTSNEVMQIVFHKAPLSFSHLSYFSIANDRKWNKMNVANACEN